jgi:hypothetical protein
MLSWSSLSGSILTQTFAADKDTMERPADEMPEAFASDNSTFHALHSVHPLYPGHQLYPEHQLDDIQIHPPCLGHPYQCHKTFPAFANTELDMLEPAFSRQQTMRSLPAIHDTSELYYYQSEQFHTGAPVTSEDLEAGSTSFYKGVIEPQPPDITTERRVVCTDVVEKSLLQTATIAVVHFKYIGIALVRMTRANPYDM